MDDLLEAFDFLKLEDRDKIIVEPNLTATCLQMCPSQETAFRQLNGLLHRLELSDPSLWNQYLRLTRKASRQVTREPVGTTFTDTSRAVKQFQRSSAGQVIQDAQHIRPTDVLCETVNYLVGDLISIALNLYSTPIEAFCHYYDFVFDRLRSVRQDLVIQRACDHNCLYILEKCVEFYLCSEYLWELYCSSKTKSEIEMLKKHFDSHLNRTHLNQCLSLLISFYDYFNDSLWSRSRPLFEAIYLTYDYENSKLCYQRYQKIKHCNLSSDLFRNSLIQAASQVLHHYVLGNHIKCLRLVAKEAKSSPLFAYAFQITNLAATHLQLLKLICVAFKASKASIPLAAMSEWFCPGVSQPQVEAHCFRYIEHLCTSNGIPVETPKVDHFEAFGQEPVREKKLLLNIKFANMHEWKVPVHLRPIGWLPSLSNQYHVFM